MENPDNGYWAAKERRMAAKTERQSVAAARSAANISLQQATTILADRLEPYRIHMHRKELRRKLKEVFAKFAGLGYDGNIAYQMAMDAIFAGLTANRQPNTPTGNGLLPTPGIPAFAVPQPLNVSAPAFISSLSVPRPAFRLNPNAPVFIPTLPTSGPAAVPSAAPPASALPLPIFDANFEDEDEYINKLFAAEPLKKEGGRKQTRRIRRRHRSRRQNRPRYLPQ